MLFYGTLHTAYIYLTALLHRSLPQVVKWKVVLNIWGSGGDGIPERRPNHSERGEGHQGRKAVLREYGPQRLQLGSPRRRVDTHVSPEYPWEAHEGEMKQHEKGRGPCVTGKLHQTYFQYPCREWNDMGLPTAARKVKTDYYPHYLSAYWQPFPIKTPKGL